MDKETEEKIVELRKAGWKYSDLMKEFNICNNTLQDALKRHSLVFTAEDRKKRDEKIIEVSKANRDLNAREVADILGLNVETVRCVRKKAGLSFKTNGSKNSDYSIRAKKISKTMTLNPHDFFSRFDIPFEYVDSFEGVHGKANLRCNVCGRVASYSCENIRHGFPCYCKYCHHESVVENQERRKQEKQIASLEKEKKREEEKRQREEIKRQMEETKRLQREERLSEDRVCKECGAIFHALKNEVFCSYECRKKNANRKSDRRLNKKNSVDKDITLQKLYNMHDGRCYICGGKCDYNDYTIKNGHFCCGPNYPSIEHIKPLSKGGKHEWKNVNLAHHYCNTIKRSNLLDKKNCVGQTSLFM